MIASRILSEKGREVFTVSPSADLEAASRTLAQYRVGAVVVADPTGAPIGVFSERDLARAIAEGGASVLSDPVSSVMSTKLITAPPGATVDELLGLMTDRRVRHVIIMEAGRMVGLVSIGDVVKRKIAKAEAEAEAIKAYIEAG